MKYPRMALTTPIPKASPPEANHRACENLLLATPSTNSIAIVVPTDTKNKIL
jgi:hypothetical protein